MFCVRGAPSSLSRRSVPSLPLRRTTTFLFRSLRMASTLPRLAVFETIAGHDPRSTAVIHSVSGRRFTYGELLRDVADAKETLLNMSGTKSIHGQRIAFLVENSYDYVGAHEWMLMQEGKAVDLLQ